MRILYDRTGFYFFKAYNAFRFADVVELVDTPDLGSGAERRGGSSPSIRTMLFSVTFVDRVVLGVDNKFQLEQILGINIDTEFVELPKIGSNYINLNEFLRINQ